jgi:hypothetical protein
MNEVYISSDILTWLKEKSNPSVRYFTLTELNGVQSNTTEAAASLQEIMQRGTVPVILAKQHPGGYWEAPDRFYTAKYRGTVWQLMILAELGADGHHPGIRKACEFILENAQDREGYAFAYRKRIKEAGGVHEEVIPCLTGNMIWSLIKLGHLEDSRVQAGINWICKYQRADDQDGKAPAGWPYERYKMCWGKHTCHMGVVKSLKALAAIPEEKRNREVSNKIAILAEFMLKHHIFKQSHNLDKVSKPGWKKFGFPLMYQTDILEIAEILVDLGLHDPRMQEAIGFISSKQTASGKWIMENSFNGRMITNIEVKGKESKWITLKALKVLKKLNQK